jgi:hypothetical protein
MIASSTMCETRMVTACSLRARSHYQTMIRATVARNTGTSVQPTDASHTRPVRMASDLTAADGITARAYRATDSFSGRSFSLSRSHSHGWSRRGITNDLDARRVRFVCQAIGDPGSEHLTLESSRLSPVFRGSSLELRTLLSRWLRGGCAMQVLRSGRGGDIEMCLSMRMHRSSGLQMRMNEWFRESGGYYSFFVSHMLVSESILCTASLIFFFRFILLSSYKLHVLVRSLLFSAFFAIDKGGKGCTLRCCRLYTCFMIPRRIGAFRDNLR